MRALERALAERAPLQFGLVTTSQLRDGHVSERVMLAAVERGQLAWVHPGVVRVVAAPRSWRQSVLAAVLAGGTGAVASHQAAAVLLGLDGFTRAPVAVTTRRSRNFFTEPVVTHRPVVFHDVDRAAVGPIPCTSVALTLINLGAVCRPLQVEVALDGAVRDGLVQERFVRWRMDELAARGRPGIGVMRAILAKGEQRRPHSYLERVFLNAAAGTVAAEAILQYELYDESGRCWARVDFCWPELRVILEVEGHGTHATRRQRAADAARTLRLSALGWKVIELTYEQVVDTPGWAVGQVLAVLGASRPRNGG